MGTWEPLLGNLGTFTWEPGNLLLGNWEPFTWELLLGNLYLGTFTWELLLGNLYLEPGNLGGIGFGAAPVCSETFTMAEDPKAFCCWGIIKKNRFNPANHQPPCFQKLQIKPGLWMTSWYLIGPQRFNGHFRNLNLHNCQYHIKSLNKGIFPQHMALYNYMVQYLHLGSGQSPTTGRLLINAHLRVDTCR